MDSEILEMQTRKSSKIIYPDEQRLVEQSVDIEVPTNPRTEKHQHTEVDNHISVLMGGSDNQHHSTHLPHNHQQQQQHLPRKRNSTHTSRCRWTTTCIPCTTYQTTSSSKSTCHRCFEVYDTTSVSMTSPSRSPSSTNHHKE